MIYFFHILLIIILLSIIFNDNNLYLILCSSIFSLICAILYYIYNAPDVALAEAAIGSAIIPVIYIIAISKHYKRGEKRDGI
ncbi:multicomponent Na+:H+ antiporter subunit B [Acetoanaerobium pronyense]|uniref:Multicomponent Na+:H+ antiporter subunit B n=1 Tax=Acetoanaerobium pronyense TaxID=1482736 RepID=A0ABS4KJE1_9FIRM|nr:multicomponent Na+:H+ antiporter subunit B [Acetoanaerobium pronyense]